LRQEGRLSQPSFTSGESLVRHGAVGTANAASQPDPFLRLSQVGEEVLPLDPLPSYSRPNPARSMSTSIGNPANPPASTGQLLAAPAFVFGRVTNSHSKEMLLDRQIAESADEQSSIMQGTDRLYCIFCFLNDGRVSKHITEKCTIAFNGSGAQTILGFGDNVRNWGRSIPANPLAKVHYCPDCRLPSTEQFHSRGDSSRSNRSGCFYNDTLNRAAWAFFTKETFFDRIYEFSNHSIQLPTTNERTFKQWLMQEPQPGRTNLSKLYGYIVELNTKR
jgi:hypothetical protein